MPQWIHSRAEHLLARNPSMPKGEAFAIATQQSHAGGHTPKGYGTAQGKREAKAKFDTPKNDVQTANPGDLKTPKLKEAAWKDLLPGGLADDKKPEDFNPKELAAGAKVEREHTSDPHLQKEIAMDHMTEFHKGYYPSLEKMEGELKKKQASAFSDELSKIALIGDQPPSLTDQLGKPKERPHSAMPPTPHFRVKQGEAKASLIHRVRGDATTDLSPNDLPLDDASESDTARDLRKTAFAVSQFSGTLGGGNFFHPPLLPGVPLPNIYGRDPQLKESGDKAPDILSRNREKNAAANALTPAGRFAQSQEVGKPKTTGFSGPSISDISKPVGFGQTLPGTRKNRI